MRPKKSQSKRVNPEPGVHVARLIQIIDWGSQVDKFSGDEGRAKVELVWELPQSLHVFNEDKGEQPLIVSRKYGNTLGRGSALKKDIESMLGHAIDKEFEFDGLLGELCQINLSVENDGEYENVVIQSLMPLGKDLSKKKFPEFNEQFVFDLDNFNQDLWDQLPEWKQKKIEATPEYAAVAASKPAPKAAAPKANGKATPPPAAKVNTGNARTSVFAQNKTKAGAVKGKK
jgi:hypothetical protein